VIPQYPEGLNYIYIVFHIIKIMKCKEAAWGDELKTKSAEKDLLSALNIFSVF
jgi:hypothetical protein